MDLDLQRRLCLSIRVMNIFRALFDCHYTIRCNVIVHPEEPQHLHKDICRKFNPESACPTQRWTFLYDSNDRGLFPEILTIYRKSQELILTGRGWEVEVRCRVLALKFLDTGSLNGIKIPPKRSQIKTVVCNKHFACNPGYIPLKEHTNIRQGNSATDVSPGEENHLFPKQLRTYTFVYLSCGVVHPPPDIKIYERCPTEGGINNFVPDSYPPPLGLLPL
ncbi:hypothetical protein TNCV_752161 [Trichonephila clavipes]|uniref:Uncharacterized protein n=1 Tax=Trichonephila clavipes TaxID=2585209 RepID=A0A8X6WA80_TRICX|nr:hypothetical protein TNCV_752161 [Trichonephila clavipes]